MVTTNLVGGRGGGALEDKFLKMSNFLDPAEAQGKLVDALRQTQGQLF